MWLTRSRENVKIVCTKNRIIRTRKVRMKESRVRVERNKDNEFAYFLYLFDYL